MIKTKQYLLLLLPILMVFSCYKDRDDSPPAEVILEVTPILVNTIINGQLSDLEGNLISDYLLLINGESFIVENTYFSFKVNDVNKRGQVIYALKDGKTVAFKTFLPIENDINRIELVAFPTWTTKAVNPNDGGIFSITDDITIDFSDASFINVNGEPFPQPSFITSGVFSSKNKVANFGFNANGALMSLTVKSGFYFNFTNTSQSLAISPEQAVQLTITNVSEDKVLYQFDSTKGIWAEIAPVIKGNIQVNLKRPGYFILVKTAKGIFVEGKSTKDDLPVAYQKYAWETNGFSGTHIGTESGKWLVVLPTKSEVPFRLVNPCGGEIQHKNIFTQKQDIENENIMITEGYENYQFLTTKVVNCDGEIETAENIHLKIADDQTYIYGFNNDDIKVWLPVCSPFTLSAYDSETNTEGPDLEWSTNITDELSFLTNCPTFSNGFTYLKIRDETKIFPSFVLENDATQSLLRSTDNTVRFTVAGTEEGAFLDNQVNIYINVPDFGSKGYYISCENSELGCGMADCFISHYDTTPDGSVRISFSGSLWMRTIAPVEAGYFDVEGVIYIKN